MPTDKSLMNWVYVMAASRQQTLNVKAGNPFLSSGNLHFYVLAEFIGMLAVNTQNQAWTWWLAHRPMNSIRHRSLSTLSLTLLLRLSFDGKLLLCTGIIVTLDKAQIARACLH